MNQAGMRASIESHMQWLQASIKQLERQIDDHIDGHPGLREDAKLITSIPGVGNTTAANVMACLGDVRRFKNAKALVHLIYGILKSGTAFSANFLVAQLDIQDGI